MKSVLQILAAAAAVVFLTGSANAQQCATGRCAVAPAATFAPSYSYAAPAVVASPVFVQPLLFVVPGVPTTAVTAPPAQVAPAAAPVQQYIPHPSIMPLRFLQPSFWPHLSHSSSTLTLEQPSSISPGPSRSCSQSQGSLPHLGQISSEFLGFLDIVDFLTWENNPKN
jgi:hypothetical protein